MAFSGLLPAAGLLANKANRDRESAQSERQRIHNMVQTAMERKRQHEEAQRARREAKHARNWSLGLAAGGAALGAGVGGLLAAGTTPLLAASAGFPALAGATVPGAFSGLGALAGAGVGATALGGLAGNNPGGAIAQGAQGFSEIYQQSQRPTWGQQIAATLDIYRKSGMFAGDGGVDEAPSFAPPAGNPLEADYEQAYDTSLDFENDAEMDIVGPGRRR